MSRIMALSTTFARLPLSAGAVVAQQQLGMQCGGLYQYCTPQSCFTNSGTCGDGSGNDFDDFDAFNTQAYTIGTCEAGTGSCTNTPGTLRCYTIF